MKDREWMNDSKCAVPIKVSGQPTDVEKAALRRRDRMFFGDTNRLNREAKDFCSGRIDGQPCPVQTECLDYAIHPETDSRYGVWAAFAPDERAPLHPADVPTVAKEDLPSLIVGRMKELGISYREASERSNGRISAGHISAIANGAHKGRITDDTLHGLSAALEVPMDELTA